MEFRIKGCIGALMMGCVFAACEDDTDKGGPDVDQPKEATYLLYMVGQNDLKQYLNANISDMKIGYGKSDINANVLVYADISSVPTLYLIGKDNSGKVQQTTVKTYPDQYSVDPEVMKEVINDVFTLYPAERNGVAFSSHANGSLYTPNTVRKRAFGDEESGYSMNITDIREALEGCPYMDVIMFDACLMANMETAYELKDRAHYFLAAPNSIPAEGFPYDKALPHLLKMDAAGLARAAQAYMKHFQNNDVEWDDFVSISVSDLSQMNALALYMDSLFQDEAVQNHLMKVDRDDLQMFEMGFELYDYGEWVDSIGLSSPYVPKIRSILDEAVVYKEHSDYSSVNDYTAMPEIPIKDGAFSGLSTYVPPEALQLVQSGYDMLMMRFFTSLKWYRDAGFWRVPLYNIFEQDAEE